MIDPDPIGRKTDEELAREARADSRRSFEELALRYKRRLFVYFRPRLGSDQDAEDLVQETFLKLYRNIHNYDPALRCPGSQVSPGRPVRDSVEEVQSPSARSQVRDLPRWHVEF